MLPANLIQGTANPVKDRVVARVKGLGFDRLSAAGDQVLEAGNANPSLSPLAELCPVSVDDQATATASVPMFLRAANGNFLDELDAVELDQLTKVVADVRERSFELLGVLTWADSPRIGNSEN